MAVIKGKWKWNDTIIQTGGVIEFPGTGISFTSNGESWMAIEMCVMPGNEWMGYVGSSGIIWVYDQTGSQAGFQGWSNEAYKIIDFGNSDVSVDDEFYKALIANATEYIEVPEEYNTKAINLNQLKRVYDNLNDKITSMSGGEIDTAADYTWTGSHTFNDSVEVNHMTVGSTTFGGSGENVFNGSVEFNSGVDFTNATITGLPKFSFDATTGTLTIVSNGKN